jgi:hypothetical protein
MEAEFVPYQEALALKELGFDEPCFAWHVSEAYGLEFGEVIKDDLLNDAVLAPTWGVAFRWFREKYELYSFVFKFDEGFGYETYKEGVTQTNESFDTYEEAELACLEKLIEIVKNK